MSTEKLHIRVYSQHTVKRKSQQYSDKNIDDINADSELLEKRHLVGLGKIKIIKQTKYRGGSAHLGRA
jgi:hypothetical protein